MKIAIVGAGLAAECFKHYFFNFIEISNLNLTIDQYSSDLAAATTETTTSIIAKRGLKRGISPLGDLLSEAYDEWEEFYNERMSGVIKCNFEHRCSKKQDKHQQFLKRFEAFEIHDQSDFSFVFEEGYLIDNDIYFKWLKDNQKLRVNKINKLVKTYDELSHYDFVFYFTGAIGKYFGISGSKNLDKSKLVQGTYLISDNHNCENYFKNTNVYEIDGVNFIYRPISKQLIVGATSNHWGAQYMPDYIGVKQQYEVINKYFDLPDFDTFKVKVGLRLKGRKRTPYIGVGDSKNSFVVNGLYKNGYTVAYLGAKKAVEYFKEYLAD